MSQWHPSGPAKCYPSTPKLECNLCERRRFGEPQIPERRLETVIDASAIRQKSTCGMWMGKPVVVSYSELEEAA